MIKLISRTSTGVCQFSVSEEKEIKLIDRYTIAPTSTAMLVTNNGLRVFMLNGDKTEFVEL